MLKKNIYKILLVLWLMVIFTLSLLTIKTKAGGGIPHLDKIVHFCFYFILSWVLIRVFLLEPKRIKSFLIAGLLTFVICSFTGILIEWLQSNYTTSRHGDVKDVIFNIFGTVVAISLTYLVLNTKKQ